MKINVINLTFYKRTHQGRIASIKISGIKFLPFSINEQLTFELKYLSLNCVKSSS